MKKQIRFEKLALASIMEILDRSSLWYTPPLSQSVELQEYAKKLYAHANFILCRVNNEMVGYCAFYRNSEKHQLYVPLICVAPKYQRLGLGSDMFLLLINMDPAYFTSIGLEVVKTNSTAYGFYLKHGFVVEEDRGLKYLMVKWL